MQNWHNQGLPHASHTLLNPLFAPATSLSRRRPEAATSCSSTCSIAASTPRRGRSPVPSARQGGRPPRRSRRSSTPFPARIATLTADRRPPSPRRRRNRPRVPYRVYASDETGDVVLTCFRGQRDYLEKHLPIGAMRYVSGLVQMFDGTAQIVHPGSYRRRRRLRQAAADRARLSAHRRACARLAAPRDRTGADQSALNCPNGSATMYCGERKFPPFAEALRRVHQPRRHRLTSCPTSHTGRGSPMTNCSRANSRWRWCAAQLRRPAGMRHAGNGELRRRSSPRCPIR